MLAEFHLIKCLDTYLFILAESALGRWHLGDVQGAAAGPAERPAQVRALPPQPAHLHAPLPGMHGRGRSFFTLWQYPGRHSLGSTEKLYIA